MVERVRRQEIIPPGTRPQNKYLKPAKKGEKVGKPRGPNKMTRVIKEATLLAAEQCGEPEPIYKKDKQGNLTDQVIGWRWPKVGPNSKSKDGLVGYLRYVAKTDARSFCGILAKILPTQISTADDDDSMTAEELLKSILEDAQELGVQVVPHIGHDGKKY